MVIVFSDEGGSSVSSAGDSSGRLSVGRALESSSAETENGSVLKHSTTANSRESILFFIFMDTPFFSLSICWLG